MSRPQVTITLGRSGQVVKRPWSGSDGLRADTQKSSGYKRATEGTSVQDSTSKRLRGGDGIGGSSGYIDRRGAKISSKDLRLKLLRKRMSNRIKLEIAESRRIELSKKMSEAIQSSEGHERPLRMNMPSTRRTGDSVRMESLQSSYNSHRMGELRLASSQLNPKASGSIGSSRYTEEMVRLPLTRPTYASRNEYRERPDFSDVSRFKGPMPMAAVTTSTRTNLSASQPMKALLPPSTSMLRSTYPDEPLTVSGLLLSLGLSKYGILFQAEEVDIAVLKQMGDRDLKELGIPMGPRKKILLALMARSKRPIIAA